MKISELREHITDVIDYLELSDMVAPISSFNESFHPQTSELMYQFFTHFFKEPDFFSQQFKNSPMEVKQDVVNQCANGLLFCDKCTRHQFESVAVPHDLSFLFSKVSKETLLELAIHRNEQGIKPTAEDYIDVSFFEI
ncbi:MAG: hypothetical protein JXK07_10105 [Spirochaetes bacterium]|nr:hypothetical protein [Spirochaetota bacterium]